MSTDESISTLYLKYQALAAHAPGCSRAAADLWEVTQFEDYIFSDDPEPKRTTIRLVCTECNVACLQTWEGVPTRMSQTTTADLGYGSAPIRQHGLVLWAGPILGYFAREHGPWSYYVTTGLQRPSKTADIAGIVGWHQTIRGAIKWSAGVGLTAYGSAERGAETPFASRGAAVKWIAGQLAAATVPTAP